MKRSKKDSPAFTRREFIKAAVISTSAGLGAEQLRGAATATSDPAVAAPGVSLSLLDGKPLHVDSGVSFGIPWAKGTVKKSETFILGSSVNRLPLQSWPLAYWPDGSVKWTGFATVVRAGSSDALNLSVGAADAAGDVKVSKTASAVTVTTGAIECVFPLAGANVIESIKMGGSSIVGAGQLVSILQKGPQTDHEDAPARERFVSHVGRVTVEQSGPVRSVVRVEGKHKGVRSGREWLPFTLRFYFYTGQASVRVVHTITFDGDQEVDFVRGLGLRFAVPLRDEPRNRTVRFTGVDGGVWSEPLQPGGGNRAQEEGQRYDGNPVFAKNAIWDDFKLMQVTPDGFTVVKRTNPKSCWLGSHAGERASGYAHVGDLGGGLGVCVKNFWQSYPAALDVMNASGKDTSITAWLWSPDGPQMDMRHYDLVGHGLDAAYEDVQPGLSTATGVSRTSELTLYPAGALPTRAVSVAQGRQGSELPLLTASPEYMHSTGVFGVWSLPDRSTPFKKGIEEGLDQVLNFYKKQIESRKWYGYWHYGDLMHSYSAARHVWHYDWGGHAWDNTELGVPLWVWYSFLRTGRGDVFRMAEALTRNTSETNVYSLGPLEGLGSRHNVVKWGCGSKEARISQAAHWRPFYYLTTDERTGDILRDTLKADEAIVRLDPMRLAAPQVPGEPQFAARLRIGPDWFALAGNWMTEWERTGDKKWLNRILAGVDSIVRMPYWLQSGQLNGLNPDIPGGGLGKLKGGGAQIVGFDLATGKLTPIRDPITKTSEPVSYNLATIQGGGEVMFELVPLLDRPDFEKAWSQYCRIGGAPADVLKRDQETGNEGNDGRYVLNEQSGPRLAAYAYWRTKSAPFAEKAVAGVLSRGGAYANPKALSGPEVLVPCEEALEVNTNEAAQTGLATIQILELCKDHLPTDAPVRTVRGPRPPANTNTNRPIG